MKKPLVQFLCALFFALILICSAFAAETVFVCDGGTGDGKTPLTATASLEDAFAIIGDEDGTIVLVGPLATPCIPAEDTRCFLPKHAGKITFTSVYGGVDYRESAGAELRLSRNLFLGGETVMDGLRIVNEISYRGIFAMYRNFTVGKDVVTAYGGDTTLYPCLISGSNVNVTDASCRIEIHSGTWQRVRLGNSGGTPNHADVYMAVYGGHFAETITMATTTSHTGNLTLEVNGGVLAAGIAGTALSKETSVYSGDLTVILRGGEVYGSIQAATTENGILHGNFTVRLADLPVHVTEIVGTAGCAGDMRSVLYCADGIDAAADVVEEVSFTSLVRKNPNGADPWLFFHDGYYYYIATAAGKGLQLVKAPNLGDLVYAESTQIYMPEKGKEWSSHLWSPEIHYFSAEEIGEQYAGWYCFLGSQPDDAYLEAHPGGEYSTGFGNQRAYVIKCLDGDNLLGRWGNPITGEVNVPQKIAFPDSDFNVNELTGGCSVITIGGVKYITFISEVGRETSGTANYNFYQTINIAKFTNPWTIEGKPQVICKPEYDWEKGGSGDKIHPQVVEGATAVYGPNGEVYIIYSGSGYWTAKYQLGQLTYIGGDPTDAKSWSKKPTPIFSQSEELVGCGHASYVTDTNGQGWICYHAYPKGSDARRAYVEPYHFTKNGVEIGNRTGHPAPISTVYTVRANPLPIGDRTHGFTEVSVRAESMVDSVALYFAPVESADAYRIYRDGVLLATVTETTYTDADLPLGKYTYLVEAVDGDTVLSDTVVRGSSFAGLRYADMNADGRVNLADVLLLVRGYIERTIPDSSLIDAVKLLQVM